MNKAFLILLFSLFVILGYCFFLSSSSVKNIEVPRTDSLRTIKINIVGDLMCHSTQFIYAHVEDDSFDFTGVFTEVKQFLSGSDLTIGNLETVFAGKSKGYSGFPFFNTPDDFLFALKDSGFDLLITANNHALDQGEEGVLRTIEKLNEYQLNYTGAFSSQNDRDSIRIFNLSDVKLSVIAYTFSTNDVPLHKGKDYLINMIDFKLIGKDIESAREAGAEIVLVHFHYGSEYKREPTAYQKDVVNKTIELGADIIIGGHPHVIQPVDYFKTNGGKMDTGFVAYSIGNFISNQRWRYSDAGMILSLEITKNLKSDSVYINKVSYLPTWVFRGNTENGREYIILPSTISIEDTSFKYLTKSDRKKIVEAFEDTRSIITKYNSRIEEIVR